MSDTPDPHANLDGLYEPFPAFAEWPRSEEPQEIDDLAQLVRNARELKPAVFHKALEVALRAAAFDTGALEALYPTDWGLTFTVALQVAAWEAEVQKRSADALRFFEAQLRGYELVLDAVTRKTSLSEAWLRRLHEEICAGQETYTVWTSQGKRENPLPKGIYKSLPNHVLEASGKPFAYAPVAETAPEMARLLAELRSAELEDACAVDQAAYAHYALVRIHPFADGNGRVARALASLFLYRAHSVPLMILSDQRERYLYSLKAADQGKPERLTDFFRARLEEALELVAQRVNLGENLEVREPPKGPAIPPAFFGRSQNDRAADWLEDLLRSAASAMEERDPRPLRLEIRPAKPRPPRAAPPSGYRPPTPPASPALVVSVSSCPDSPAEATVLTWVPESDEEGWKLRLRQEDGELEDLEIDREKLLPRPGSFARLKVEAWLEGVVRTLTRGLTL